MGAPNIPIFTRLGEPRAGSSAGGRTPGRPARTLPEYGCSKYSNFYTTWGAPRGEQCRWAHAWPPRQDTARIWVLQIFQFLHDLGSPARGAVPVGARLAAPPGHCQNMGAPNIPIFTRLGEPRAGSSAGG